jgi:translation initiation factor IF-3
VPAIKELQINDQIREREVRLIDADGQQLGVMPTRRAIDIAMEKKLDLVNVAPNAKPPVCKILDYGKYKYELAKKEKEARKNQRTITVKEVRMSPNIDTHDLEVKARNAREFLKNGDKVKVSVRFRGRELGHTEVVREVLDYFVEMVSEYSTIEKRPAMEGRSMVMFLGPKSSKED